MDESQFHRMADRFLEAVAEAVEDQIGDAVDVEAEGSVVSLELPDGGIFLLNKNAPMTQLWLSSPKSGAWHFSWDAGVGDWRSTRDGNISLAGLLADELATATGVRPSFAS